MDKGSKNGKAIWLANQEIVYQLWGNIQKEYITEHLAIPEVNPQL